MKDMVAVDSATCWSLVISCIIKILVTGRCYSSPSFFFSLFPFISFPDFFSSFFRNEQEVANVEASTL
jgi:hypothetical protein